MQVNRFFKDLASVHIFFHSRLLCSSSSFSLHTAEPSSSEAESRGKMCHSCFHVIPSSLRFSPAAHAVTSESSGEITAAGRLQLGVAGRGDGPATQQGETL